VTSLWMWWQGYVTVRLRGPGLERLLNRMAELGFVIQWVERLTTDVIIVRLRVKDFRRLRPLLWGTQVSVSILDKHGAPFWFKRFRLRASLALGLLLSFFFVLYLSNFVWFIEVRGSETLSLETLSSAVQDLGLQAGVARSTIKPREIEAELLKRFPVLAWAQVTVKGVRVEISLTERDGVEPEESGPGHVYAAMDGVVTEVLVLRGTPHVKDGQTVRKGDLLISGEYYDARGRKQYGAAQGVIKARVWYEGIGEGSLVRWEPVHTGRNHRQYAITIGNITIPVGRSYSLETHLKSEKEWQLSLGQAMVPLRFARIDYQEVEYIKVHVPSEEARKEALRMAWDNLKKQGVDEDQVREERQQVDFLTDAEGVRVTLQVEVLDDIGQFLTH